MAPKSDKERLTSREDVEAYFSQMGDADIEAMLRESLGREETGSLPQSSRLYDEVLKCSTARVNIEGMTYIVYREAARRWLGRR